MVVHHNGSFNTGFSVDTPAPFAHSTPRRPEGHLRGNEFLGGDPAAGFSNRLDGFFRVFEEYLLL